MLDHAPSLVIFCKRPALFQGKQRLAKTIGAAQTFIFAQAFLDCALEDARAWPGPVVLSPASVEDIEWAGGLLTRNHQVLAQPEGCLGTRLQNIDQAVRQSGPEKIVFIGTDAPILSACHYDESRIALSESDIVLSPAADGGVTIMGSRTGWPDMSGLPWSTNRLGSALENLCEEKDLTVKNMSPSYDIDHEEDLWKLWHDLAGDPRPARQKLYGQLDVFLNGDRD